MTGVELATGYVSLVPSAAGIGAAISKEMGAPLAAAATQSGADASKGFTKGFSSIGSGLTKTLTPAAAAIGLAFHQSFQQFDGGADAIIAKTGAVGAELDGMVGSMKTVGGQVVQPLGVVGAAIGDVAARLKLTGPPLEEMTKRFLDLSRLTGSDVSTNIANVSRVFGDWEIGTARQSAALDMLYGATQQTGIGIDRLTQLTVQYGAPLRQLGFSFEETVALLGKFENEGVNVETVMGGLRIGLARMSSGSAEANEMVEGLTAAFEDARSKVQGYRDDLGEAHKALELALTPPTANSIESLTLRNERAVLGESSATTQLAEAQAALDLLRRGSSPEDIEEAERDVERAKLASSSASDRVSDAERALRELREDEEATAEEISDAERVLVGLRMDAADAADAAGAAQDRLDEVRSGPTADDVADAERRVEEARIAQREATLSVSESEQALIDLRKQGTDQDEDVIAARERVAEVSRDLAVAQGELGVASRDLQVGLDLANTAAGDVPAKFQAVLESIKNAATDLEAVNIAKAIFSTRAGADIAEGIRQGRFEIDDLVASLGDTEGALDDAAEATLDHSDKLLMLKNRVQGALGPFGEIGMAVAGVAAGAGPAISGIGKLTGALGGASSGAGAMSSVMTAMPWLLVAAGAIALVYVIVRNWDTIVDAIGAAWSWIGDTSKKVWNGIGDFFERWWPALLVIFTGGIAAFPLLIVRNWDSIVGFTSDMAGKVVGFIGGLPGLAADALTAAWGLYWDLWVSKWIAVGTFVGDRVGDVVGFVTGLPGEARDGIVAAWSEFSDAFTGLWSDASTMVGDRVDAAVGFVTGLPGKARDGIRSAWSGFWSTFTDLAGGISSYVGDRVDDVIGFVSAMPSRIADAARGMWDGIGEAFKDAINIVIDAWNSLDLGISVKVPDWVPGPMRGKGFEIKDVFPDIARLGAGGIATGPTFAMIGEAGHDEAIVPLPDDWTSWGRGDDRTVPQGETTFVAVTNLDSHEIARVIVNPLAKQVKRRTGARSRASN